MEQVSLEVAKKLLELGYEEYVLCSYELATGRVGVLDEEVVLPEVPEGFIGLPYTDAVIEWLARTHNFGFGLKAVQNEGGSFSGYQDSKVYLDKQVFELSGKHQTLKEAYKEIVEYVVLRVL